MGGTFRVSDADTKVFTTGMVAGICRVSPRTVTKWFDAGILSGYRIPSGKTGESGTDRRVIRHNLVPFMKKHDIPLDLLPGGEHGGGRVLAVGLPVGAVRALAEVKDECGQLVQVVEAQTEFDAGVSFRDFLPDVAVVSIAVVDQSFAHRIRAVHGCEDVQVFAVTGDYAEEATVRRWQAAGFTRVVNAVGDIAPLVAGWRAIKQAAIAKRNAPLAKQKRMKGLKKAAQRVA